MKILLAAMFIVLLLLVEPVVDQALADSAFRPNLHLAPLAIWIGLCPGAPAVIACGFLGLIVDCLAGQQLGGRAACFCLIAALASLAVGRRDVSWLRRTATWGAVLFSAELVSRLIAGSSLGPTFRLSSVAFEAGRSALVTTVFLSGVCLLAEVILRAPRATRSFRRLAPAGGRSWSGD